MACKRIKRELNGFNKNPTDGWSGGPESENDLFHWLLILSGPDNSPYKGGRFYLSVNFPTDYPFNPPKCRFITRIYHPNITNEGIICKCCPLKELGNDWSPKLDISMILKRIRDLLIEPYLDYSCGSSEILNLYIKDKNEAEKIARQWTEKYAK